MTELESRTIGAATILLGEGGGKYPDCNSVLVQGTEATILLDPGLGVRARLERGDGACAAVDTVVLSHCHEDHIPGLPLFDSADCWVHEEDLPGLQSMEGFLDLFGMPEPQRSRWREVARERFFFRERPDARSFADGHVWELGGGVSITAIHAPGHTRGHCAFQVDPGGLLFLADVDLSGFGPYYGDRWSSLVEFEATLERLASREAEWFLSGHHVGLLDPAAFRARMARYRARIEERETALLDYLAEPRSMAEVVAHRFIYRPGDEVANLEWIERRSMEQHLERLVEAGRVESTVEGRWVAVAGQVPS